MKKITDLTETKYRTVHNRNRYGNLVKSSEPYEAKRKVKTIKSGPRIAHFIADSIFIQILLAILQFVYLFVLNIEVLPTRGGLAFNLVFGIIFLVFIPFIYFVFESSIQQTPGKMLTNAIVIDEYGNKPTKKQIALRSIIRLVPFEPLSCFDNYSFGWHDEWSDTFVVTKEELATLRILIEQQNEV